MALGISTRGHAAPRDRHAEGGGRSGLLLGQPIDAWMFATRIWVAMSSSLAAAFWLQLANPSPALVTVAILALPYRGRAFNKALYRAAATVIGFAAAIVITALFAQTPVLLLVASAAWIALAVRVGALQDGNRAYATSLAGYTVANISMQNVDAPQSVFADGIQRVAAILVGIAALCVINDVLAAPSLSADLRRRLRSARSEVDRVVAETAAEPLPAAGHALPLLTGLVSTGPDIDALPSERAAGSREAAAARSAVAAMLGAIAASRMLALARNGRATVATTGVPPDDRAAHRIMRHRLQADLAEQLALADAELAAIDAARPPLRRVALPIHRARKDARRRALRVFIILVAGGALFAETDWPETSLALTTLSVLAGLSAGAPDAKVFARNVVIGVPLAIVAGGLTKFLLLDGADSFPLLMLALAPVALIGCLALGRPRLAGPAFIVLVFFGIVLSPTNPQTYNVQDFLVSAVLMVVAAFILALALAVTLPTTDKLQRHWIVEQLQRDVAASCTAPSRLAPAEATVLAIDRLTQLQRFGAGPEVVRVRRLEQAMLLSLLILAASRAWLALDELARDEAVVVAATARAAQHALASLEPGNLNRAASQLVRHLRDVDTRRCPDLVRAISDLAFLAIAITNHARTLRYLRPTGGNTA